MHIFGFTTDHHSHHYTVLALRSFFEHTPLQDRDLLYIIDNTGEFELPEDLNYRHIRIVRNKSPHSYATNMNRIMVLARQQQAGAVLLNNDLIFTRGWFDALQNEEHVIISPLSNLEVQYESDNLKIPANLELHNYIGQEYLFQLVVAEHQRRSEGFMQVLALPFFAVKIPYEIIKTVGLIDQDLSEYGGEDYDYCLRAYNSGFQVQYALSSYIFNFGADRLNKPALAREPENFYAFESRWGRPLAEIMLREKVDLLKQDTKLNKALDDQGYAKIIERLQAMKPGRNVHVE